MWKLACFVENEGVNTMAGDTILYISDQAANSDSVLAALKAAGYEVVSTNSSTQALALLFFIHSVAAVVLNQRTEEQNSFDLARSLRKIRPDVPMVLLCGGQIDCLPLAIEEPTSSEKAA